MSGVFPALLAGLAAAAAMPVSSRARLHAVASADHAGAVRRPAVRLSSPAMAALAVGVGTVVLFGGLVGMVVGVVAALSAYRFVARLEPASVRRRREELVASLPAAVDLLGSCLSAGLPVERAMPIVSRAIGGPVAAEFDVIAARLVLGSDPATVWRDAQDHAEVAPLCRTMARAVDTGAPLAEGLARLAGDMRRRQRDEAEKSAAAVGVRAAAPLGLCFLPAFLLIGIVPTVVSGFLAAAAW